jgi:hypothetical protein
MSAVDQIEVTNEFLINIKNSIERMTKNNQIEVLKILKSHKNVKLNENKSGVLVNISFCSKELLSELNNYVKYVNDQERVINNVESQKQEFKNTFFFE